MSSRSFESRKVYGDSCRASLPKPIHHSEQGRVVEMLQWRILRSLSPSRVSQVEEQAILTNGVEIPTCHPSASGQASVLYGCDHNGHSGTAWARTLALSHKVSWVCTYKIVLGGTVPFLAVGEFEKHGDITRSLRTDATLESANYYDRP